MNLHRRTRQTRPPKGPPTALVLSGGGVRGAYEVGVIQGMMEVLGKHHRDQSPFQMFAGTSVGAINASYLAAHGHRGDLGIHGLCRVWETLKLSHHLRIDPLGVFGFKQGMPWDWFKRGAKNRRSFLDAGALENTIRSSVPWQALRTNIERGATRALFVTALHIATGRTTVFADLNEDVEFVPTADPQRQAQCEPITAEHVLASAALPLLFPARQIGKRYYCDGGLRFNTPLAPVIRAGARRIVIISLLAPPRAMPEAQAVERYPNPIFLAGKLLNALLLDPILHDLNVLRRFNKLLGVLDDVLTPEERTRVDEVLREMRGVPYRRLQTLSFRPSLDIGQLAAEHVRFNLPRWKLDGPSTFVLRRVARADSAWEADLASYLLFDGTFSKRLIELGRRDAHDRTDAIRAFFAGEYDASDESEASVDQTPDELATRAS